jgi:hypothetical protein
VGSLKEGRLVREVRNKKPRIWRGPRFNAAERASSQSRAEAHQLASVPEVKFMLHGATLLDPSPFDVNVLDVSGTGRWPSVSLHEFACMGSPLCGQEDDGTRSEV